MSNFKKIAELSSTDRSKLKEYWTELWGSEFANALTKDYKPEGESKRVEAGKKPKPQSKPQPKPTKGGKKK